MMLILFAQSLAVSLVCGLCIGMQFAIVIEDDLCLHYTCLEFASGNLAKAYAKIVKLLLCSQMKV